MPPRTAREGVRDGAPFAAASFFLAVSFGVVAHKAGLSAVATIVMSAVVFAGAAQFAAIGILAAGGGVGAAVAAAALMNSRFLPMGVALAPSLRGGPLERVARGQAVTDSSWVMAQDSTGRFDLRYLLGNTGIQYVGWVAGTTAGALGGNLDAQALGLDAVYPTFFLALLVGEVRDPIGRALALGGGLVALALAPLTPAGVPVLAASALALVGLHVNAVRSPALRPDA